MANSFFKSTPPVEVNEFSVAASAPGKVILFGEHSVVYGKPAIAAALSDLRISVLLTPYADSSITNESQTIHIIMADLGLFVKITKTCISSSLLQQLPMPPSPDMVTQIESFMQKALRSGEMEVMSSPLDLSLLPIVPVLFLLVQLAPAWYWKTVDEPGTPRMPIDLKLWVRSKDLPVGAGLGSSAAFSVALVATLIRWKQRSLNTENTESSKTTQPAASDLQEINKFAYASEILLHGTPSGLDNAVSTHGGALWYTKDIHSKTKITNNSAKDLTEQERKQVSDSNMTSLSSFPTLQLLLVHTHVPRSTKALVAGVRTLYNRHTSVMEPLLDAMGALVTEVRDLLTSLASSSSESTGTAFLELVRLNQDCLRALSVSHPRLDEIDQLIRTKYASVAAAKLTGAGGGGCALVLLHPSFETDIPNDKESSKKDGNVLKQIEADLKPLGFTIIRSLVGGPGVLWQDPNEFSLDESAASNSAFSTWAIRLSAIIGSVSAVVLLKNGVTALLRKV